MIEIEDGYFAVWAENVTNFETWEKHFEACSTTLTEQLELARDIHCKVLREAIAPMSMTARQETN